MTTYTTPPRPYIAHAWCALFVALKLTGAISWPWLAVTAPLWGHLIARKLAASLAK